MVVLNVSCIRRLHDRVHSPVLMDGSESLASSGKTNKKY